MKDVYKDYFQKSKIFLFPQLDLGKGSIKPLSTYTSIPEVIAPEDYKLLCLYQLRTDKEFLKFEKTKLFKHHRFESFRELVSGEGLYIFDFQDQKKNFDYFYEGKYSKLDDNFKQNIINYYVNKSSFNLVDSYINPHNYYEIYSKLLLCPVSVLKETVELCDKPDLKREALQTVFKKFDLKNKINI
jgi:hypothetical protein